MTERVVCGRRAEIGRRKRVKYACGRKVEVERKSGKKKKCSVSTWKESKEV